MKTVYLVLILGFTLQSCSISFTASSQRMPEKKVLQINPDVQLSLTGAVYMNFFGLKKSDYIPASTQIITKNKVLYIDPILVNDTQKADYILITHNHADHFWEPEIKRLLKPETIIIAPESITKKLTNNKTRTIHLGDIIEFDDLKCEVFPAYNLKEKKAQMTIHQKSDEFAGYFITLDTIRIYHAGDTDFIPEMKNLRHIDVALLPIGGGITSMSPVDAAAAANEIKPDFVVPIHYEPGKNHEMEFSKLVDKNIIVVLHK